MDVLNGDDVEHAMFFLESWLNWCIWAAAAVVYVVGLLLTAKPAAESFRCVQPAWRVAAAVCGLLWLLQAQVPQTGSNMAGPVYHLLGINLAVLMLGAPAAWWLVCVCMLVFSVAAYGASNLVALPLNSLLLVAPACLWNVAIRKVVPYFLPHHLFLYIFIYGFLAAGTGMLLTGAVLGGFWHFVDAFPYEPLGRLVFPVFLLLAWGEAFLTGLLTAIFVSFRPAWLTTFDDHLYLKKHTPQIWKD